MTICLGPLIDPNTGRPAVLQGYAAVFCVPESIVEDGFPRILAPEAFDTFLAIGRAPNLIFNHQLGGTGFMASGSDSVRIWKDPIGLAFEATNLKHTVLTREVVRRIANGFITGCSWQTSKYGNSAIEKIADGREMHVIRDIGNLYEFGPCDSPAFEETGIWLSSAGPCLKTPRLSSLAYRWKQNAPAGVQV